MLLLEMKRPRPGLIWGLNLLWPGLGLIAAGQIGTGLLAGLITWIPVGLCLYPLAAVLGIPLYVIWYVVVSTLGHSTARREFARALEHYRGGV